VQTGNEVIVVEQDGKPVAVVISPDQYERYREAARERFFQTVDQIRADNAAEDPDQIYEDVTAVVEQVRQEIYDRERHA
jgi:PHD/YefM family antitoxin component YafN of YafNO toxin-antitoxin module